MIKLREVLSTEYGYNNLSDVQEIVVKIEQDVLDEIQAYIDTLSYLTVF